MNYDYRKKFPKREHLKSKKLIKELFEKGRSINFFPIRILYLSNHSSTFSQVMIVVPKKKIKYAVDRNRIRRQIKEVYRINKFNIFSSYIIAIIFISDKIILFQDLESKLIQALKLLNNK